MRKKAIFLMMALALASTPAMLAQEAADTTFVFKDIKVNPTTSVKDQNKSGTCWSFSGVSFLEDELLKNGKGEFDLSEMYIARQCYIDKAIHYVRYSAPQILDRAAASLMCRMFTMRMEWFRKRYTPA